MAINTVNRSNLDKRANTGLGAMSQKIVSGGADSILARLFRKIIHDNGVTPERFNSLMELYLSDRRNSIPQNTKDRASARGNFRKELLKNNMSWKVFCKGLRFLNVKRFDLAVDIEQPNGKMTHHVTSIDLGDPIFDEYIDPELMSKEDNDFIAKELNILEEELIPNKDKVDLTLDLHQGNGFVSRVPVSIMDSEIIEMKVKK